MLRGKGSIVPSTFLPRGLWCAEDACFMSDTAVAEVAVMVNVYLVSALFHLPRVMSARLQGRWYDSWGREGVERFQPESPLRHQSWASALASNLLKEEAVSFHSPLGPRKTSFLSIPSRKSAKCSSTCVTPRYTSTWAPPRRAESSFTGHRAAGKRCWHTPLLGWGLPTRLCLHSFCSMCLCCSSLVNLNQTWHILRRIDFAAFLAVVLLFVRCCLFSCSQLFRWQGWVGSEVTWV